MKTKIGLWMFGVCVLMNAWGLWQGLRMWEGHLDLRAFPKEIEVVVEEISEAPSPVVVTERRREVERESFALTGLEMSQPTFDQGRIELSFSSAPDVASLAASLRIDPPVKLSVHQGNWWRGGACIATGDFQPGLRYRLELPSEIRGVNGRSLARSETRDIIFPHPAPDLKFVHSGQVLNAAGARRIAVETEGEAGLEMGLYRVYESNLVEYSSREMGREGWQNRSRPWQRLGSRVWESEIELQENGITELDLSGALEAAGHGVYQLRVKGKTSENEIERMLVVSEIGMLARRHGDKWLVWAVKLDSAEPVADLEVLLWSEARRELMRGETDATGLATLTLPLDVESEKPMLIMGRKGGMLSLLSLEQPQPFPGESPSRHYVRQGQEAFVYTGRGMYRPGEKVNARAIVRGQGMRLPGDYPVMWTLFDAGGLKVWEDHAVLSEVGTVESVLDLKSGWASGAYQLRLSLPGDEENPLGETRLHVESFVPPQVVVETESPQGDAYVGDVYEVKVQARMLYGGAAANHETDAVLTLVPEEFRSSEYPDHRFSDVRKPGFDRWSKPLGSSKTNSQGEVAFQVVVPPEKRGPSALRAVVGISVKEFSGRAAMSYCSRRVDVVPYYAGMKLKELEANLLAVDLVGLLPDNTLWMKQTELEMEWFRLTWQRGYKRDAKGRFTYVAEEVAVSEGSQSVVMEGGRHQMEIPVSPNGIFRVAVTDGKNGVSASRLIRVGNATGAPDRADEVKLEAKQPTVVSGGEVEVMVHAPFAGRLLFTVEGDELLHRQVIEMSNREETVSFVLPETAVPAVWVRATVVRPQPGRGAQPVLRSEGALALRLHQREMNSHLDMEVAGQLIPGETVGLRIRGVPGSEVVVAGVDEGILRLSDFVTPDPMSWFCALRRVVSTSWDGFDALIPELGLNRFAGEVEMGGGLGLLGGRLNPVDAKRFDPFSWWSGAKRIPGSGVLELAMVMPEFSGEVRWMAVAVGPHTLAHAEARSKVGRPLVVQQSLPLFLAPGDATQWTVRLHNRQDRDIEVALTPGVSGPIDIHGGNTILHLKAGEVRLHRWEVTALNEMGVARCAVTVETSETMWTDQIELAVRPVQAFQKRARRWNLAPGEELEFGPEEGWMPNTGRREVEVSSFPALQVSGARSFLMNYPYGCVEQTASQAMGALLTPTWVDGAEAGSAELVNAGIVELWRKQRQDGGFGYWTASDRVSVPGTFEALIFLLEAKSRGFDLRERSLRLSLDWTRKWLNGQNWRVGDSGRKVNREITQACLVLAMADELDAGWIQRLRERRLDLDQASRVQAAEAMMRSGYRPLAAEMLQGVTPIVRSGWGWYSVVSENAHLLRVLLALHPSDGRIIPLVQEILKRKNERGIWGHTYENAAVLRALEVYAERFGGEEGELEVYVRGFDGENGRVRVENEVVQAGCPRSRGVIQNRGSRPVYVEERLSGIPLDPMERVNSFEIERELFRVNGQSVAEGEPIQSGELMVIRLRVSGLPGPTEHLVLDQRLPAGVEPLPLAVQRKPAGVLGFRPKKKPFQAQHLEVRDDRVLIFPGPMGRGSHEFLLVVRAVSPGRYAFPAVHGQDMYEESLQSAGAEGQMQVLP